MAALMPQGKQQYFTAGGIPLVGGKVYTYAAGTTTPLATYTTAAASTPNTNPVILDSRGEASIFFSAANYKIVVKDSLDSTIWTQDNLPGDAAASVLASLAASTGSSLVGHIASGTGAVATTVQSKLRQSVSVEDFGVTSGGTATANTTAFRNALSSLTSGGQLNISTSFSINDEVNIPYDDISIVGIGSPLITQTVAGLRVLYGADRKNVSISGLRFDGILSSTPYNGVVLDGNGEGLIHFYKSAGQPENIRITDCEIYNAFTPISCTNVHNLFVERNIIRNFYKFGILASESYNFAIDNNFIYTCENNTATNVYGIQATGDSNTGDVQARCSISFNIIDGVTSWDGIMSHDCTGLRIIGNDIRDVRCGIDITHTASTQTLKDIIISNNYIVLTSTNNWGATPAQHSGVSVIGVASSTYITGVIISNNIIKNANALSGAVFSGNVYACIHLDTVADMLVSSNVIEDFNNVVVGYDGIAVYNPGESVKICDNILRGAISTYAIRALLATGATSTNLSAHGNSLTSSISTAQIAIFAVASGAGTFNGLAFYGNNTNTTKKNYITSGSVTLNFEDGDGVFTPALAFGGASVGITYAEQAGQYRKSGNKVWFNLSVILTSKGSSTGTVTISLPFTAASVPAYSAMSVYIATMASITGQVTGVVQGTLAIAQLFQITASTPANLTDVNFTNTSKISMQGFIVIA